MVWYSDVMRKKILIRLTNCIIISGFMFALLQPLEAETVVVNATTINEVQQQIQDTQNNLNELNDKISDISDEQDLVAEKIDDLNAEIVNMMTSIGIKEDEIAEKVNEITDKENEIILIQEEYEAAKWRQEEQYEAMKIRLRLMYENGNSSMLSYFLESADFNEMLNKADYMEKVYEYDKNMLEEYEATKNQAQELWDEMEAEKQQLETDKSDLEAARVQMEAQKVTLEQLLAQKRQESANYDAELARYTQEAAAEQKKLRQEQQQLKRLQQQRQPTANSNATSGNYSVTGFDTSIIDQASGSEVGRKIAKYACQFIGNPYVTGGTSLTNGADCSGFTYRAYSDFGYTLPRTSYEQRSAGVGVNYSEAQPGDLICYDGHVGIYVGGGYIVHASSAKTGIKISQANYRTILAVRRIL